MSDNKTITEEQLVLLMEAMRAADRRWDLDERRHWDRDRRYLRDYLLPEMFSRGLVLEVRL